jgi:hypothetical protein
VLVPLLADRFHVGWGLPFQKLVSLVAGPVAVWFGYRNAVAQTLNTFQLNSKAIPFWITGSASSISGLRRV